jgi:hypothetical protein
MEPAFILRNPDAPPMPIYVEPRTPGIEDAKGIVSLSWESVCHSQKPFVWVHHSAARASSRWGSVDRARPFLVERINRPGTGWSQISAHKTLRAAVVAARRFAKRELT